MCTTPNETCLRSFFLKVFFLPFFSGAAVPAAAAAGFAIKWSLVVRRSQKLYSLPSVLANDRWPTTDDGPYVFAAAFLRFATVPLRGPFRVRALVCVRCPRTGRLRR